MELAKKHIRDEYYLVGIVEELPLFLKQLECGLPRWFEGATSRETPRENIGPSHAVTQVTLNILQEYLSDEIELYQYARSQFFSKMRKCSQYCA